MAALIGLAISALTYVTDTDDAGMHGVQARLANLGYYTGAIDGDCGPATRAAIAWFQDVHGLPASEEVDVTLLEKLAGEHGC